MVSKRIKRKPRKSFEIELHLTIRKKSFGFTAVSLQDFANYKRTLPPLQSPHKKTVFLDLDETLVHTTVSSLNYLPPENYDFAITFPKDENKIGYYVLKRPFVDEFLKFLSERFEIVVFTAGKEKYASAILDKLDSMKVVSHRFYRDSCTLIDGSYVKDLSKTGRNLNRVVILDDNQESYMLQPENGIPIDRFTGDLKDEELKNLIPFFKELDSVEDVRDTVKLYQAGLFGDDEDEDEDEDDMYGDF